MCENFRALPLMFLTSNQGASPMDSVSLLAELTAAGIEYTFSGEQWVKVQCPYHSDVSASGAINLESRWFKCHAASCGISCKVTQYFATILNTDERTVLAAWAAKYGLSPTKEKYIDAQHVETCHVELRKAKPLLHELYKRGVTDHAISKYRLGLIDGCRISIPVKSASGLYVNIRKYLPGAPGDKKFQNVKGHGKPIRFYPIEQLTYSHIVLCGGEIKAIVAAEQLNQHGIGAISLTSGEGKPNKEIIELLKQLKGKVVWVCYDIDEAGRRGSQEVCRVLTRIADWVGNVELPLDRAKYPKGDINDYIGQERGNLYPVLEATEQFNPGGSVRLSEYQGLDEPERCTIAQATSAVNVGKRIEVEAVVSAIDIAGYSLPKGITVQCDRQQDFCGICPIYPLAEDAEIEIPPESPALLEMLGEDKNKQRQSLMSAIGIPSVCRSCDFRINSYHHIEDCRISPQIAISNTAVDRSLQVAYCVVDDASQSIALNECYHLIGRMYPHPATQQAVLLISEFEQSENALDAPQVDPEIADSLRLFQPQEWTTEAIGAKLAALYDDLEANVTRIYQRKRLHLAVDLAYHSPLLLTFDGRDSVKGWAEVLIVGDSAQGKSEVACGSAGPGGLMHFYGLGEKVECKNASAAGLIGGVQQLGNRWFTSWGVIPTHDRRLVILEELKGASRETISRLTDMRSSGVATISKIDKRKTMARTRIIALSNTRSGFNLSSYNYGINAVTELVGALEDVRRFDMVLLVSADDVAPEIINRISADRPHIEHIHKAEHCRNLILWAWTRRPHQVVFKDSATVLALQAANELCNTFTDVVPIVDRGGMRFKLARLAAALAARTFSTDDGDTLLVRECHVEYIAEFLKQIYSSSVFGYKEFTEAHLMAQRISEGDANDITATIKSVIHPKDFVTLLLRAEKIDLQDLQDYNGIDIVDGQALLSLLVRKHALVRDGKQYRKTPAFIALAKRLLDSGELDRLGPPSHIREDKF